MGRKLLAMALMLCMLLTMCAAVSCADEGYRELSGGHSTIPC